MWLGTYINLGSSLSYCPNYEKVEYYTVCITSPRFLISILFQKFDASIHEENSKILSVSWDQYKLFMRIEILKAQMFY